MALACPGAFNIITGDLKREKGGKKKKDKNSQALVAQACKPAWGNSSGPYLNKTYHKKGTMEWLKVKAHEFKPQYHKNK
jgi:hypothetical protein